MRYLLIAVLAAGCGSLESAGAGGNGGSGGAGGDGPASDAPLGDGSAMDGGGTGGTGGSGGSGGGDGTVPTCRATLSVLGGPNFVDGDPIALSVNVVGDGTPTLYSWSTAPGTIPAGSGGMTTLTTAGSGVYHVTVLVQTNAGAACGDEAFITVLARDPTYVRLRVTPPTPGAPRQVFMFLPADATQPRDLSLQGGTTSMLSITNDTGADVPGYVRLTDHNTCLPVEAYPTASAAAPVNLLQASFDILVIPADSHLAPVLLNNYSGPFSAFGVLAGAAVPGHVLHSDGTPVADAHVELFGGAMPSSIAPTLASDGSFEAHTSVRSAPLDAVIAPPDSSLPIAQTTGAPIPAVGFAPPALAFTYDAITPAHVSGTVSLPVGGLAVGAHITFVAHTPFSRVGQLTINGGTPIPVGGTARAETDTSITSGFGPIALPPAVYEVLVEPPAASALVARTRTTIDLTGGDRTVALTLSAPVQLSGTITDSSGQPHMAIVRAVERGATASYVTPMPQSSYLLNVDPGATYDVDATPVEANIGLGRVRATVAVPNAGATLPLVLPAGIAFSGAVRRADGSTLAGALVEAMRGPECAVSSTVVADTVSAADGTYRIVVPVP